MSTSEGRPRLRLHEHPTFLLAQLGVHTTERFGSLLAPLNIQPRHVAVLSTLLDRSGISQQQLCESLHIHRNVMVGMVDELERRGLVERRRHPVQRRAHALHVLPAGAELLRKAEEILDAYEAELFESDGSDVRSAVLETLQRIATRAGVRDASQPECGGCGAGEQVPH
ncbi:MarR family winged helix-turn-helix transcriptional regulator [Nocardia sp. NPDC058499]|uniref:MarR family winged helix-turn-helix transcriptional regulator n=1 Tax=Nocardia sp. NPDC058499 TaxID=3346530 RepID=UPI00365814F7